MDLHFPKNDVPTDLPTTTQVRFISTQGSDKQLVDTVKKYEPLLQRTRSFSDEQSTTSSNDADSQSSSTNDNQKEKKLIQYVKKTGTNIRNRLVKVKSQAIGNRFGPTEPCRERNCKCCSMIWDGESKVVNGHLVKSAPGTCSTYNVIYLISCKLCSKSYVGRTTRPLKARVGEHRRGFYHILHGNSYDENDDSYSLGLHLKNDHGFSNRNDFGDNYEVRIIDNCSPSSLEVIEHKFIHSLQSLKPIGLNSQNPFGLAILNPNFGSF